MFVAKKKQKQNNNFESDYKHEDIEQKISMFNIVCSIMHDGSIGSTADFSTCHNSTNH